MSVCTLCPRRCGIDRNRSKGICGVGAETLIAGSMLHHWEEPCISGNPETGIGSGAVFFSGCPLHCVFCQNAGISRVAKGEVYSEERLGSLFLDLQARGAYNLNLVSPTQYTDTLRRVLEKIKPELSIPVVWNTGGYERAETIRSLKGLVDIYLTDFKFGSERTGMKYASAANYVTEASAALREMVEQTGTPSYGAFGDESTVVQPGEKLLKGTIVRHLILPGEAKDSLAVLDLLKATVDPTRILLALMSQYTPGFVPEDRTEFSNLKRRITTLELQRVRQRAVELGFVGFSQDKSSAEKTFTPVIVQ